MNILGEVGTCFLYASSATLYSHCSAPRMVILLDQVNQVRYNIFSWTFRP